GREGGGQPSELLGVRRRRNLLEVRLVWFLKTLSVNFRFTQTGFRPKSDTPQPAPSTSLPNREPTSSTDRLLDFFGTRVSIRRIFLKRTRLPMTASRRAAASAGPLPGPHPRFSIASRI